MKYVIVEYCEGYLPESEPADFDDLEDATGFVQDRWLELDDMDYFDVVDNAYRKQWKLEKIEYYNGLPTFRYHSLSAHFPLDWVVEIVVRY